MVSLTHHRKAYRRGRVDLRHMSSCAVWRVLVLVAIFVSLLWLYIQALFHFLLGYSQPVTEDHTTSTSTTFLSTLRHKKILFEVTTVGMRQFAYLEHVLDSVRDLCEAGANISLHIITTNCPPSPTSSSSSSSQSQPCALRGQSSETTLVDNYPLLVLDQLNERLPRYCRDIHGSIESFIHIKSPDWGKQVIDFHRYLFYDHINDQPPFDLFIHTEEDTRIRPVNVLAFLQEIHRLQQLVGMERWTDYSMGFIRFENQMEHASMRRVVWEFEWDPQYPLDIIQHPGIQGKYFTTPPYHHQGMYMATREQLLAWKTRKPFCHFDIILRRQAYHTERVSGAVELFSEEFCNVTQLIPLDSTEDFYVHHLPNSNHKRSPQYLVTTRKLHQLRMQAIQEMDPSRKLWVDKQGKYNGIHMFLDEEGTDKVIVRDMTSYQDYVTRGGMLSDPFLWMEDQE